MEVKLRETRKSRNAQLSSFASFLQGRLRGDKNPTNGQLVGFCLCNVSGALVKGSERTTNCPRVGF